MIPGRGFPVFFTRILPEPGLEILCKHCDVNVWPQRLPPSRAELREGISGAAGVLTLVTDPVDGEMMDSAPDLRVISNYAVGYDNIDVSAATERGIAVTNTPGVLTEATADFLLGQDVHGAVLGRIGRACEPGRRF